MWEEGRRQLRLEGFDDSRHEIITQADMKYEGQVSDLTVAVPSGTITQATLTAIAENFDQEHEQSFGYRQDYWRRRGQLPARQHPRDSPRPA